MAEFAKWGFMIVIVMIASIAAAAMPIFGMVIIFFALLFYSHYKIVKKD